MLIDRAYWGGKKWGTLQGTKSCLCSLVTAGRHGKHLTAQHQRQGLLTAPCDACRNRMRERLLSNTYNASHFREPSNRLVHS